MRGDPAEAFASGVPRELAEGAEGVRRRCLAPSCQACLTSGCQTPSGARRRGDTRQSWAFQGRAERPVAARRARPLLPPTRRSARDDWVARLQGLVNIGARGVRPSRAIRQAGVDVEMSELEVHDAFGLGGLLAMPARPTRSCTTSPSTTRPVRSPRPSGTAGSLRRSMLRVGALASAALLLGERAQAIQARVRRGGELGGARLHRFTATVLGAGRRRVPRVSLLWTAHYFLPLPPPSRRATGSCCACLPRCERWSRRSARSLRSRSSRRASPARPPPASRRSSGRAGRGGR